MRHSKLNKKFGRNIAQRKALINSLVRALFQSYRINTTLQKAKEARKAAEKLITSAKKGQLADIRKIEKVLQDKALVSKAIKEIAPLFANIQSGYTRIIKSGFRKGDGADMAVLELTNLPEVETEIETKKTKAKNAEKKSPKEQKLEPIKSGETVKTGKPAKSEDSEENKKGLLGKVKKIFKKEDEEK
ncbi:MAG: 50S ribosomal protein L17 [Candidatus Omnitrophota bacterium]